MDMNLSKLWRIAKDRGAQYYFTGQKELDMTERLNWICWLSVIFICEYVQIQEFEVFHKKENYY